MRVFSCLFVRGRVSNTNYFSGWYYGMDVCISRYFNRYHRQPQGYAKRHFAVGVGFLGGGAEWRYGLRDF